MTETLTPEAAEAWVKTRLIDVYQRLRDGMDVSPRQRLSLEGQIDLLLAFELLDREQLVHTIEALYQEATSEPVNPKFWQWNNHEKIFRLPIKMTDAPVYKS